ncbi:uncharacterized protein KQ657_001827 [Scheffersomyces spartinae]|uniref:Mitochondrial thiamine pyrophosphate carrier 1 n=1 Tax=Scheffersomyces spartinae TaxID=45513 RepID=A0A9P7V7P2_9ASCO|nr:uncharacterized protein KQ657_001827 [Scheffersomyces spartinae]KAG7192426.1 hypothetical protein KQ657_001827 [Scheffersomyces spartinae]
MLNLIKIRLQLSNDPFKVVISNIVSNARKLFQQNPRHKYFALQFIESIYRGIGPNLLGNMCAWSLYFTFYNEYKRLLGAATGETKHPMTYFASSTLAGLSTGVVTNPIWVTKVRLLASSKLSPNAYRNMWHCLYSMYLNEGILLFWKGGLAGTFLIFQGAFQITLYDKLKDSFHRDKLSTTEYIYCSLTSKVVSMLLTYPGQVVRAQLQNSIVKLKISQVISNIYKEQGLKGFFRGVGTNLLRVVPATVTTFLIYEKVKDHLQP